MTRSIRCLAATIMVVATAAAAWLNAQSRAEITLRAASEKVLVEGDLRGALTLYEQAEREAGPDRSLAARALLGRAETHRKLGDSKAPALFAALVQKYPDQPAQVSAARAQLGGAARPAFTVQRLEVDAAEVERVSPDGRFLLQADEQVTLYELATRTTRQVTIDGNPDESDHRYPLFAVFSRDGKQIAYDLYIEKEDRSILRTVPAGESRSASRTLYDNPDIDTIRPTDWSPDGRSIAVLLKRRDRTAQIGLVRADDGTLRVLRTVEWIGPTNMVFSRDGRSLAYDRPAAEGAVERDVFLMDLEALKETPIVVNPSDDRLVGWTIDGRRLLFTSDRSGATALWAATIENGRSTRPIEYLNDLGVGRPAGMTNDGALFYKGLVSGADIWVANVDRQAGRLSTTPARLIKQFKGLNQMPEWSADGKSLAYVSKRDASVPSPVTIAISSAETGDPVREVHPRASYLLYPKWSPDGRTFIARGADLKGRSGILRIDAATGETSVVALNEKCSGVPYWAAQGRTFFCYDFSARRIVEVDVDSSEIKRTFAGSQGAASPDGRSLAFFDRGLKVLPLAGGPVRELLPAEGTSLGNLMTLTFTPDSQAIVFRGTIRGTAGVWWVDLAGGEPRRLDIDPKAVTMLRFNPKTWQLAYAPSNGPQTEIRKLEHFVPAAPAPAQPR
jgi:Tol biopolymer transport system component